PIIADQLAHKGAVVLLDEGAVVLLPGPASREGDALPPAVVVQEAIDEFGPVVAVEADQGHRQALAHGLHAGGDAIVSLAPERLQLDPAGGHNESATGG